MVAAAFAPDAVVSEVARRAGLCSGQIYRWRQDLRADSRGFAEVIVSPAGTAMPDSPAVIEVTFGNGQARIPASAPPGSGGGGDPVAGTATCLP